MRRIFFYSFFTSLVLCSVLLTPTYAAETVPDGSFENFDDTWECTLNCTQNVNDYILLSDYAVEGIFYAYIFHSAEIYQDLTIPNNASSLSFYYDNQNDDDIEGSFSVSFLNPETEEVYTTQTFDQQSDIWITGSLDVPADLQGEDVRLLLTSLSGFNRMDLFEFQTPKDEEEELVYPVVKLRILSAKNTPVKDAKMFILSNGKKVSLRNTKTDELVKTLISNKKGRVPRFEIQRELEDDETLKLCVKKKKVKECGAIAPENGLETSYEFTFSHSKVTRQ